MIFTTENIFFLGSMLVFASILISKTGYRFGVPTLLLCLFTGMLFGSDGLGLQFHSAKDAQFIGMISLSVILFTGGMDTKFKTIRPIMAPGVVLSTLGVMMMTVLTGAFIYLLARYSGLDYETSLLGAFLLSATMSSTDSASVFNLLRSQGIGLKHNLRPLLELESGSNDPMAYMLTIALMEVMLPGNTFSLRGLVNDLVVQFTLGAALGYAAGKVMVWTANRINLPNAMLYPVMILCMVCMTFTLTDLMNGNGYLAVYIAGLVIGNSRMVSRRETGTFMDGMTWLLQIVLFVALGLLVNPSELVQIAVPALVIGLFMMFLGRPATVFACLLPFRGIPFRAKIFTSWVGLRGAVPIIFATYPLIAQVEGAQQIFNVVFFITLLSLMFQGTTISRLARWLKLDMPEEKEGNEFGIEIPEELGSNLREMTLTPELIAKGDRLAQMNLPKGTLVMMIKRGEEFIVPNGQLQLREGDILLLIANKGKD